MKCLVLNSNYTYLNIITSFDALCLVLGEKAEAVESYDKVFRSQYLTIPQPAIVVMKEYKNTSKKKKVAPVSTRTILVRDNFICAFCGCKLTFKNGTRDHIIPVSRGGKNILSNLVASCKSCNLKKDNKLLSECGMKLLFKPRELTSEEVLKCRIKTLSSKERNTWVDWLKANNVTIW